MPQSLCQKVFPGRAADLLGIGQQARQGGRRWRHGPGQYGWWSGCSPWRGRRWRWPGRLWRTCSTSSSAVLLVGTYHGQAGQYASIQAAVNAAQPGDWILVAPGDYHEADDAHVTSAAQLSTGDHGGVVVTTVGPPHPRHEPQHASSSTAPRRARRGPCSSAPQDQNLGPGRRRQGPGPQRHRRVEGDNVSIENLTVCNFQGGAGDSGNEVWWNGGDGSGKIGLTGYTGSYLTGTIDLLRHREHGGRSTASSRPTRRVPAVGTRSTAAT